MSRRRDVGNMLDRAKERRQKGRREKMGSEVKRSNEKGMN